MSAHDKGKEERNMKIMLTQQGPRRVGAAKCTETLMTRGVLARIQMFLLSPILADTLHNGALSRKRKEKERNAYLSKLDLASADHGLKS